MTPLKALFTLRAFLRQSADELDPEKLAAFSDAAIIVAPKMTERERTELTDGLNTLIARVADHCEDLKRALIRVRGGQRAAKGYGWLKNQHTNQRLTKKI